MDGLHLHERGQLAPCFLVKEDGARNPTLAWNFLMYFTMISIGYKHSHALIKVQTFFDILSSHSSPRTPLSYSVQRD